MLLTDHPPLLLLSVRLHVDEVVFVYQFYALLLVARGTESLMARVRSRARISSLKFLDLKEKKNGW